MKPDETTRRMKPAESTTLPAVPAEAPTLPAPNARSPAATSDELPVGAMIDRYIILSLLGRGGMGTVYAAYDPVLDRKIAVKVLHPVDDREAEVSTEGRARMQREAQALARLSHPNVITVHDVSEYRGAMYIAMELVGGGTLADWQTGKSWRQIVEMYAHAARGLAAAHAAGLVHRDFKPENVLVGEDGRVRVTDFGLARLAVLPPEEKPVLASPTSQLASALTVDGAVMGTPSYMAPEQIDGGTVDARSDQFSWCIALWEALYGEQPWPKTNLAIRSAAMKVDAPKLPAKSKVPRAIGKLLVRGLAPEPDQRWPDLDAIVVAIRREMSPRRAIVAAGVAAIALALVIVFVVGRRAGASEPSCTDTGAPIEAAWSPQMQGDVLTAFRETGAPFAADAFASVDRSIASWRERWRSVALESCRATRVSGTQSEALLDMRSACLARRRDELVNMIAALAHADRKLVENARAIALPDLDTCSDAAVLAGATPAPTDPAVQQPLAAVTGELAAVERELMHGLSLDRAHALEPSTNKLVERAIAIGWPPIEARARLAVAGVQRELGQGKQSRATLMRAAAASSAANDLDGVLVAYTELIYVEALLTSEYALGDSWAVLAEGLLARLGPRPDKRLNILRGRAVVARRAGRMEDARAADRSALAIARTRGGNAEVDVLVDLGIVESELGDLDAAVQHLEEAQRRARAELGDKHPVLAAIEHNLGNIAFRRGRYVDAERRYREALVRREAAFGLDDLLVANTAETLGIAILDQGRLADAKPYLERALDIMTKRLGPDHPDVANALNDIGGAYHQAGDYENELATGMRALAIREKALGPDHPDVAQSLVNTAIASKSLGRFAIVEPHYKRALAILEKTRGPDHVETAITRLNFAEALRAQGKLDDAAAQYERARVAFVKELGEDHPLLGHIWNGVGQLEMARGHTQAAVPILERAVALRAKDPGDPTALAESRFALARALAGSTLTKIHPRVVELATQARDAYRQAGAHYAKEVAEIEAWLR